MGMHRRRRTITSDMFIGRRNVEGGGRQDTFHNTGFRGVVGVRGAISENWDYDASAQYSKGNFAGRTLNRFVLERSQRAIDVVTDPDPESPIFRYESVAALSSDGTDPNCVPYNIFDLSTPPTEDALALPAGADHLDRPDRPGDLQRHRHGRSRRHRAAEPVCGRKHPDGSRYRAPLGSGGVRARPAAADAGHRWPGRPRHPLERQRQGDGLLRRAAGPAGAGCPVRRSAEPGHGLSLLGLRGR